MSTKLPLQLTERIVHGFIYTAGCIAIWSYTLERWPAPAQVAISAVLFVLLVRYLWKGEAK